MRRPRLLWVVAVYLALCVLALVGGYAGAALGYLS
jgi:hypothetical protein